MPRVAITAFLLGLAACSTSPSEEPPAGAWFLSTVDGQALPTRAELPSGYLLVSEYLEFPPGWRPRPDTPDSGQVVISQIIRAPDQQTDHPTTQNRFTMINGELRIDLCPPLALCLVSDELIGTVSTQSELVLTHYLAGQPGSVYRFYPVRPD